MSKDDIKYILPLEDEPSPSCNQVHVYDPKYFLRDRTLKLPPLNLAVGTSIIYFNCCEFSLMKFKTK
ncbi:hypothetical protein STEG23_024601, partial [Scotinomys teguina]